MVNFNKMQAGGTIVGFILGLIVGLGIAVVVAMTISKTPVPFVNRPSAKLDKAGELTPGQIADPNRTLYGNKKPIEDAAKEFAKPDVPVAESAADKTKTDATPATVKAVDPKPTTGSRDAVAADLATRPENVDDKWIYYLQAGAFREQADAENTKGKLALLGVETHMNERPSENGTLYRVRIGPFAQVEAMNRVRSKLSDNGVDVAVVRIPK